MDRRPSLKRTAAFTLIETMLSIAVGALVILLVFSIYHTTMQVVRGQAARQERSGRAHDALRDISRRLACAMEYTAPETVSFSVLPAEESETGFPELAFISAEAAPGLRREWYRPVAVKITCETDGRNSRLVETLKPMSGPVTTNTTVLAEGTAAFSVRVYNGEEWLEKWPQPEQPVLPRAARIRIEFPPETGRDPAETEVFIPAGNAVSPSEPR